MMNWLNDMRNRRDTLITAINVHQRAIDGLRDEIDWRTNAIKELEYEMAALDRALSAPPMTTPIPEGAQFRLDGKPSQAALDALKGMTDERPK